MPMPSKQVVFVFAATGVNASATYDIDTDDIDQLVVEYLPDIAVPAPVTGVEFFDRDLGLTGGQHTLQAFTSPADANMHSMGWGVGVELATNGRYLGGLPAPLPSRIRVRVNALGVGVTATVRIYGRRNFKGRGVVVPAGD